MVLITFILILLLLAKIVKHYIPRDNWLYRQLNLENFLIIIGQYIPLMSSVFLPVCFVYKNIKFTCFASKINLIMNVTFLGISLLVPFIILGYF